MQWCASFSLACFLLCATQADAAPRVKKTSKAKVSQTTRAKAKAKRVSRKSTPKKSLIGKERTLLTAVRAQSKKENQAKSLRLPPLQLRSRSAKQLTYLREGITKKQVAKIQKVVDRLVAGGSKDIIVFRGQEKLTKTIQSEVLREHSLPEAVREYNQAAKAELNRAASEVAHAERYSNPNRAEYYKGVTGPQLLAIKSQHQYSSRYLVATTRDLATAFGNFYKAPDIRFVYILQVPREHTINTHGLVSAKIKALKLAPISNQSEKEIAIPLRATKYVRAVYDIKADKIIQL